MEYYDRSQENALQKIDFLVLNYHLAHSYCLLARYKEAREYAHKSLEWYEKTDNLRHPVEEVRVSVNEVLKYVDHMEQQTNDRSLKGLIFTNQYIKSLDPQEKIYEVWEWR